MRHWSGAAAFVRALGIAGVLGPVACTTHPKATGSRGPFLSIVARDGAARAHAAVSPAAIALALGGRPPEELARLRERLAESTDAAIARAAPDLFDVGGLAEQGASPSVREALPILPALTAAVNALGSPWDGAGISARLTASCDAVALRCLSLFAPPADAADALARRGRALAWALGHAALVRAPQPTARPALLRSLWDAERRPSGTIAMVFGAARGSLDEAELEPLRLEARRAAAHLAGDAPQRPWLEALCAAPSHWQLPIAFGADGVLVVPRLSALARLQDFAAEIERAGAVEWAARPVVARAR